MQTVIRVLLLGLLVGVPASAQEPSGKETGEPRKDGPPEDRRPGDQRRPGGRSGGEFFKRMLRDCDEDGDQKVSLEEFIKMERVGRLPSEHQQKLFKRLDKDGDGSITRKDIPDKTAIHNRHKERDLNKDGRISFEEFVQSPRMSELPDEKKRSIFDRLDRNDDGFLDRSDWKDRPGPSGGPDGQNRPGPRRPGPPKFTELDEDGDGALSFEEFRVLPGLREAGEDAQEDRFEELDENGDGKLQREEMPRPTRGREGPSRERESGKKKPGGGKKDAPEGNDGEA